MRGVQLVGPLRWLAVVPFLISLTVVGCGGTSNETTLIGDGEEIPADIRALYEDDE